MEHRFKYQLSVAAHSEIKRLIGQCIPQVKSSHRAEAVARGLGYGTNAALLAAFDQAGSPLLVQPDRLLFEGFLATRGVAPETLQVDLLYDAVALSTGGHRNSWHRPEPAGRYALNNMRCWRCKERFFSLDHNWNRICPGCKIRDGRMPRADFVDDFKDGILAEVYFTGELPQAAREFCARPGWTDVLAKGPFADSISMHVGYWEDAKAGRWEDVPRRLRRLREADRSLKNNPMKATEWDW
jgi:hypothetical protein